MKIRKPVLLVLSILFAISVISVSADISASLGVVDKYTGAEISGETVTVGITAEAKGYYEDPTHGLDASATMTVWFKGPSDPSYTFKDVLFSGTMTSGSTTICDYELTEVGSYKFKWEVGNEIDEALITTSIRTHVVPESPIGTLLGTLTPILGLISFVALKRFKTPNLR